MFLRKVRLSPPQVSSASTKILSLSKALCFSESNRTDSTLQSRHTFAIAVACQSSFLLLFGSPPCQRHWTAAGVHSAILRIRSVRKASATNPKRRARHSYYSSHIARLLAFLSQRYPQRSSNSWPRFALLPTCQISKHLTDPVSCLLRLQPLHG